MKKPIYSALIFFGTLGILSAGYAGFVTLQASDADSGKSLTSSMMQAVIGNLADLDERVSAMSGVTTVFQVSAGNVGIGTISPSQKFEVAGMVYSTSGGFKFPDGTTQTTAASAAMAVPTGAVIAFYGTVCPNGWAPADGTAGGVKKTDGTTGTLDLRGEFIRWLDTAGIGARNVDTGRAIGTWQNFQLENHQHKGTIVNGSSSPQYGLTSSPIWYANWNSNTTDPVTGNHGAETRPRNIALLYCVKN